MSVASVLLRDQDIEANRMMSKDRKSLKEMLQSFLPDKSSVPSG